MSQSRLRLAVVLGSSRQGRHGQAVAEWFIAQIAERRDFDVDFVDVAELALPAAHPAQTHPEVRSLSERVEAADAYVVITPEYNHGYPAALKHAIDQVMTEWFAKPVAFVSYGGMAGGVRAVEQLRQVFVELHAVTLRDGVVLANIHQHAHDGVLTAPEGTEAAVKVMMDRLLWWSRTLRHGRQTTPYAA